MRRTARPAFGKAVAAACMLLLLTTGIGGYLWSQEAVSYVSIDVNPSIELALNRFDRVVSVKAYNAEGVEVLKDLSLKGKGYTQAIGAIVESEAMGVYLSDGAELVFTVAATGNREDELKSGVESYADRSGHKSQSASVDMETVSQAHGCGISLGKYYAWQQLQQYDDTVTVDACKDMSMTQLHDLISEHEKEHGQEGGHEEEGGHTEEEGHAKGQSFVEQEKHAEEESHFEQKDAEGRHTGNGHKEKTGHRQKEGHR